jgi:hypothetical protein
MDTKAALKSLYQIVAKQQAAITKLAQLAGAAPASAATPAAAPATPAVSAADPTTKLQASLFAAHPDLRVAFIDPPSVGHSAGGGKAIVSFKYHLSTDGNSLKAAVNEAANQTLGQGAFLLQGIGA